jgi:hypothetical protein
LSFISMCLLLWRPPFPTQRLPAARVSRFSIGTMGALRLPRFIPERSVVLRVAAPLLHPLFSLATAQRQVTLCCLGVDCCVSTLGLLAHYSVERKATGLPCSLNPRRAFAQGRNPDRFSPTRHFVGELLLPRNPGCESPSHLDSLSRPNYLGFCTGCLRFVPRLLYDDARLASGWRLTFAGWDFHPRELVAGFSVRPTSFLVLLHRACMARRDRNRVPRI